MIYAWGNSADGQLSLGATESDIIAKLTPITLSPGEPSLDASCIAQISCGAHHSLFLTNDGLIYSCGNNDSGQLGHEGPRRKLGLVKNIATFKIVQVACGNSHSLALTKDGAVFSWGANENYQLGIGLALPESLTAKRVALNEVVQVASGSFHCLALQSDGRLFSWGRNNEYQLGLGHNQAVQTPQMVKSVYGIPFQRIACGGYYSVAVSVSGAVFAWGQNDFGQLGLGDTENRSYPSQIKSLRKLYIVNVSCGDFHTAALNKDGRLFTFGAGSYGQLGSNSQTNEWIPKQVMDLMGLSVDMVACGRCHTLALVNRKIYAFGLNGNGQLGTGTTQIRLIPTVIQFLGQFSRVYAGGDQSFAVDNNKINTTHSENMLECRTTNFCDSRCDIKHFDVNSIRHLLCKSAQAVKLDLETVFSNMPCINASFLKEDCKHYGTSRNNSGVDMDAVRTGFELFDGSSHSESFRKTISECLERGVLASDIAQAPPDVEALRVFIVLPWSPAFSASDRYRTVHVPFAAALLKLKKLPLEVIENWWASFELRHFNRILKVYKKVAACIFNEEDIKNRINDLKVILDLLERLHTVNILTKKLPFDSFYINELTNKIDVQQDYCQFVSKPSEQRFSFCRYPFIFNAEVKTKLLATDASINQQIQYQQAAMQNLQSFFMPLGQQTCPYLILTVSRSNIVQDAITQLASYNPTDMKKPLKVVFRGEEADDAGGVRKEFFMLLFGEVLQSKYGLFVEYEESRQVWFSPTVFDGDLEIYHLIGCLCGLAIYNSIIIGLPFPLALYKKLLNHSVDLEDFKDLCPTEGKSLEYILDYDGDDFEEVFSLNFQVSLTNFGATTSIDLKPNGAETAVTCANRAEYVDLYVAQRLSNGVKAQFEAFAGGFHRAVTSKLLRFFQPPELMTLLVGNDHYDWDIFEQNAQYKGVYYAGHPTIRLFWKVFRSFNIEQRRKFLLFLTGSDRVPLLGMKQIEIVIQPTKSGEAYFPVAHTCFNLLDLPEYPDEATLRDKLLAAIEHTQGFTLV